MQHNDGTRLFSGFLVSFASGVVKKNCWMKQQSNTKKQGALTVIQTGCLSALHGSQSLTALNRCGMWYSMQTIIWNDLKVMISTSK